LPRAKKNVLFFDRTGTIFFDCTEINMAVSHFVVAYGMHTTDRPCVTERFFELTYRNYKVTERKVGIVDI
jgi:hypothetical protein